jgi:hypothetical protein
VPIVATMKKIGGLSISFHLKLPSCLYKLLLELIKTACMTR